MTCLSRSNQGSDSLLCILPSAPTQTVECSSKTSSTWKNGKWCEIWLQSLLMPDPPYYPSRNSHSNKLSLAWYSAWKCSAAKYLGVTISDDLTRITHIDNITKKANQPLGFLKRNIRVYFKDLKSVAYKTSQATARIRVHRMVRPHCHGYIHKVEAVQRRAAGWATHD